MIGWLIFIGYLLVASVVMVYVRTKLVAEDRAQFPGRKTDETIDDKVMYFAIAAFAAMLWPVWLFFTLLYKTGNYIVARLP